MQNELRIWQLLCFVFGLGVIVVALVATSAISAVGLKLERAQDAQRQAEAALKECQAAQETWKPVDLKALVAALDRPEVQPVGECPPLMAECPEVVEPRCPEPVIVNFDEYHDLQVERATREVAVLRPEFEERWAEFPPLMERARAVGIGPRAREWVGNPEAVRLYIELVSRWSEVEDLYGRMERSVQEAGQRMRERCWDSAQREQVGVLGFDPREFNRMRDSVMGMVNYGHAVYLCRDDLARQRKLREARP